MHAADREHPAGGAAALPSRAPEAASRNVAVLVFDGVDVFDFTGPYEVLSNAGRTPHDSVWEHPFQAHIVAANETTMASGGLKVVRDVSIDHVRSHLNEYNILVVPGGPPDAVMRVAQPGAPELELVRDFANYTHSPDSPAAKEPIVFSVCTGAFLLAAAGLLEGRKATTHHMALEPLRGIIQAAASSPDAPPADVFHARFVDGGFLSNGVRIVTSGGVTSGLDAAFYILSLKMDDKVEERVRRMMEYERVVFSSVTPASA